MPCIPTRELPESLLKFIRRRPGSILTAIRSEASRRRFFRIRLGGKSLVAMVYPEPAPAEVERFCAVQKIYRERGLRVPRIDKVLDDQVVIQEDAGDLLLQRAWRAGAAAGNASGCWTNAGRSCAEARRRSSGPGRRPARPGPAELGDGFFPQALFPPLSRSGGCQRRRAGRRAEKLVEAIEPEMRFAHRDFHSRNLLVLGKEIVMVDFQDSLLAPRYYDLVSLAFDSYLDLGRAREVLFSGRELADDRSCRQLRLTALQRNIKALGTFAFQTYDRRHPAYARYIPRTIRHIQGHLRTLADPEFKTLLKYFDSLVIGASVKLPFVQLGIRPCPRWVQASLQQRVRI